MMTEIKRCNQEQTNYSFSIETIQSDELIKMSNPW